MDQLLRHQQRKRWQTDRPRPKLIESDFYSTTCISTGCCRSEVSLTDATDNWIAIVDASRAGDLTRVQSLLDAGRDPDSADILSGQTPLHYAIGSGNTLLVELLPDAGADIEHSNNNSQSTPLTSAVFSQRIDMVRILLERGANSRIGVYPDGQSLIDAAREESTPEIVVLLSAHGRP